MKRDIIDSLMAGGLLSFLPVWEANPMEQTVIALGLAAVSYMIILLKKEDPMHTYKIVREDFHTGQCSRRVRRITRKTPLKIDGLYGQLGKGYPGIYRVLEEIYEPWGTEETTESI